MNPEEGYDHSWISKGRKTAKLSSRKKPRNKGTEVRSENIITEKEIQSLSPKTDGMPGVSQPKRGQAKKSSYTGSLRLDEEEVMNTAQEEKNQSDDGSNLKKLSEGRSREEIKKHKHSAKKGIRNISKVTSLAKTDSRKRKLSMGISDVGVTLASCVMV